MPRKQYKHHFIYKTTCKINEKYYIGIHSTDNIEDGYLGSGTKIRNSIRAHGRDVHRIEILEFFENREALSNRERDLVNEDLLKDPLCMNLVKGGEGKPLFDMESRSKGAIKANQKNWKDPNFRDKMKTVASSVMKTLWKDEYKSKKLLEGASKSFLCKSHSEEVKKKIGEKSSRNQRGNSNSQFGSIWIYNEIEKKSIKTKSENLDSFLNSGWRLGRKIKFK